MATFSEIATKIAKLFVATDKYHQIVNGGINATVEIESGVLPTMAKTLNDFTNEADALVNSITDQVSSAIDTGISDAILIDASGNLVFNGIVLRRYTQLAWDAVIPEIPGVDELFLSPTGQMHRGDGVLRASACPTVLSEGPQGEPGATGTSAASITISAGSTVRVGANETWKIFGALILEEGATVEIEDGGSIEFLNTVGLAVPADPGPVVFADLTTVNLPALNAPLAAALAAEALTKTTLVDADKIRIRDSADGNIGKTISWLSFAANNLLAWFNTLGTITGARSFSGQVELTGQIPSLSTSAMTRGLSDARYGQQVKAYAADTQDVTNSTTLTDSTFLQVALGVGTWTFETLELVGSTAFTTAGSKCDLVFTGTGVFSGIVLRANASNAEPINQAPSWGGTGQAINSLLVGGAASTIAMRRGQITVTVAGILKVRFAQNTAVAGQSARMHVGSFIEAIQ